MIDRFITTLQDKGLLLSDREIYALSEAQSLLDSEDIADALWLAAQIGGADEVVVVEPEESIEISDDPQISVINSALPPLPPPSTVPAFTSDPTTQANRADEIPEQGLPIQVQSAPALPDTRGIGRSLRPLMRKVPSLSRLELDEIATVNFIAERKIWLPILKPAPERWFDLELVIEASKFSFIWQETLNEFQHLLECQGAFRSVRTWLVQADDRGQPKLVTKKQTWDVDQTLPTRSHKELVDASGRRMVLFVSDCRSQLWQHGQIHDWLALWSRHSPVAIVQLLPERLWSQSALDVGFAAQVESLIPGAPNHKLIARELPTRTQINPKDSLTLPVVTLTAGALKQWALVVVAAGRQRAPARLFDVAWVKSPERDRSGAVIHPKSPQERVELFTATASAIAQQLAGMMAAVPVELPVIHLIQQELLRDAKPVHIAEVYASGLLEEIVDQQQTEDRARRYNFVKGVRDLLNVKTPLNETLDVIEALSQRIARTLGFEIKSFTALLSPKSDWSQEAKDAILPFAQITTEVLHRLGGEYAELAELVERDARVRSDWIQPVESDTEQDVNFPELEVLTFMTAQLVESLTEHNWPPPLQTEEYTVATITFDTPIYGTVTLETFNFKVGYLVNLGNGWVVQKSDGQAQRYIEQIDENTMLEMVGIRGGSFMMGSPAEDEQGYKDERPQHAVTVPDFYMARYPVTQAQWRTVAAMPQVEIQLDPDPSNFKGDNRPVERVSWHEATEFCARLSNHTKRQYRLPSEAEWEYACRAGTNTPFHFGETISTDLASYNGSAYAGGPTGKSRDETTPVDHFDVANAWGLCDMHGNVWEWCQDYWHDNYKGAPENGSAWLTDNSDDRRVNRGGSWTYLAGLCRSASRSYNTPDVRYFNLGFRVVCGAPGLF